MLKTPIKASRIANLTDARYFAAWEVQWLGFCLDSAASHFLQPQEVAAIKEWIEGPLVVGEFGIQSLPEIQQIASALQLDAVQVGPFATPEQLAHWQGVPLFQELIIDKHTRTEQLSQQMQEAAPFVECFVLNFSNNGMSWEKIQQSQDLNANTLAALCRDYSVLLDIPAVPGQLADLIQKLNPKGLSFQGGAEEKVGVKSIRRIGRTF